jgi:glucose-1-phosphate cytidylyltransferase
MKVVILCGGRGYRLNEETEYRPKPMMPLGNMPILWHIMKIYATYGHKDFILCLGYKSDKIKEFFRNYCWQLGDVVMGLGPNSPIDFDNHSDEADWRVTLAETGLSTSTAGRISCVRRYLEKEDSFFLTYGDGVGNVDLNAVVKLHRQSANLCTLTATHPPGRFGELVVNDTNRVLRFNEKPQTESGLINAGYMVCSRKFLDIVDRYKDEMLEQGPLLELVRDGKLGCYVHNGFWQPMDTYQEFHLLSQLWDTEKAPWKIW